MSYQSKPSRWPPVLLAVGVLGIVAGFLISPERLIALGPMKTSLTSDIESVRRVANMEVMAFRWFSITAGVVLVAIALAWRRIIALPRVQLLLEGDEGDESASPQANRFFHLPFFVTTACWIVGVLYVAFGARLFTPEQLSRINSEDGLIEYATALLLLLCSAAAIVLAIRIRGHRARSLMLGCFAFAFFFMCGEEISWGQRIFGVGTLESLKTHNVQNENNLHNMFGYAADHLFILGIFVYGFVMPMLAYFSPFWRRAFDSIGLPIASPGLAIGFLLASSVHAWTVNRIIPPLPRLRIGELRELLSVIAISMLMYETWISAPRRRATPPLPRADRAGDDPGKLG